jgi:holo-[acyl-carrier protein] synthase
VNVIGVGVDLVDLERVVRLLTHKGEHAMQKFFTEDERAYLATRPDPTGHAAARIAAKEAVYKALQALPGARGVGWRDIEVTRDDDGRPAIRLHGLAAQLAEAHGGLDVQVSLTHSATSAGAVAVVGTGAQSGRGSRSS